MTEHDDRPDPDQPDGPHDHKHRNDRVDEPRTDVMGGPDRATDTEDEMGGVNQPPAGDDVMAPDGGEGEARR
jgi:hypothetical protein